MIEVSFDQGPMGHQRRKPTRLGTNILKLSELQDIQGPVLIRGGDEGEEAAEEMLGSVEVYSDASYASSGLKSLTGIVVCYGGTPIAWHTTRQAFITLSTAEAELMSLLESLVTVRSTGSLVEAVLERKVKLRMHSDCTAAIAIASGTTSSWRTRHLRI